MVEWESQNFKIGKPIIVRLYCKVDKKALIRNRYNQIPHQLKSRNEKFSSDLLYSFKMVSFCLEGRRASQVL